MIVIVVIRHINTEV